MTAAADGMPDRKGLLLVNRSSGNGRELDSEELVHRLRDRGWQVTVCAADSFPELADAAERAGRGHDRLIVAGGDGTVSGLLRFAVDLDIPLAIIPCGTANDFASSLQLPEDPAEAVRTAAEGEVWQCDVGRINDYYFVNAAGLGIGTYVTDELEAEEKQRWGVLAYAKSLRRALARRRAMHVRLTLDGRSVAEQAWQVTVTNGLRYGGGISAPEGARLDDGVLHVVRVLPQPLPLLLGKMPRYLMGKVNRQKRIHVDDAAAVEIETDREMRISVDGELLARTPCRVVCLAAGLKVVVPPGTTGKTSSSPDGHH